MRFYTCERQQAQPTGEKKRQTADFTVKYPRAGIKKKKYSRGKPVNAFAPLEWRVALRNEYARATKVARGARSVKKGNNDFIKMKGD